MKAASHSYSARPTLDDAVRAALFVVFLSLWLPAEPTFAATLRTWTGGSATSGNWSTAANWSGNVAPVVGDILSFAEAGARKTSNTNNFPAGRTFSTINIFGGGYRLRGNGVAISNYVTAGSPSGTNIIDLDLTAAGPGVGITLRSFASSDRLTLNGDINLNARALATDGPGDFIIAGVISGSGGIFKDNTGDLSLSGLGANTFTGTTTVGAGILRLNRYNLLGGLSFAGTTAIPGDLVIGGLTGTLIGDIAVLDRENQIANTSTVSVYATGSLELSDESDTIGELILRGGTVTTGTGSLGVDGNIYASLPVSVSKDSLIAGHLSLGSRGVGGPQIVDVAQGVQLNITAAISGVSTAHLIKTNRGELVLTASNTFGGDVEIKGGTITMTHGWALGTTNGVTKPISGTLAINGTFGVQEYLIVPGPAGSLVLDSGSSSWLGPVVLNDDLDIIVPTNSFLTIVGLISGPAGWTKTGSGTLQFKTTYTNTYVGTSWVRQGSFIMDGVFHQPVIPGPFLIGNTNDAPETTRAWMIKLQQIADTAPVTVNPSGVLEILNDTIGSLAGSGKVSLGGTLTVGANNTSTVFSGVISEAGSLVKTGSGTLTLTGTNTCTGITTNQSGTLLVHGVLGSSSVEVHPGAILGGNGQVQRINGLSNGQVSPGASPGRLQVQNNVTLANSIYRVELNGVTPGVQHDQLRVLGNVNLGASSLFVAEGFLPALGDSFVIIDKVSPGAIVGGFFNLPEGSILGAGLRISYQGGNGNDVVLTRVAVPASDISSIQPISPELMQILGQGLPFVTYILEATPHLNAPIPWTPIATNSANALGIYEFIDAYADDAMKLYPARFYRVQSP